MYVEGVVSGLTVVHANVRPAHCTRERRDDGWAQVHGPRSWIPGFAGMTLGDAGSNDVRAWAANCGQAGGLRSKRDPFFLRPPSDDVDGPGEPPTTRGRAGGVDAGQAEA